MLQLENLLSKHGEGLSIATGAATGTGIMYIIDIYLQHLGTQHDFIHKLGAYGAMAFAFAGLGLVCYYAHLEKRGKFSINSEPMARR